MLHLTVACSCSGLSSLLQEAGSLILCLIWVNGLVWDWNCACLDPGWKPKTDMQAVGQSGSGTTIQINKKQLINDLKYVKQGCSFLWCVYIYIYIYFYTTWEILHFSSILTWLLFCPLMPLFFPFLRWFHCVGVECKQKSALWSFVTKPSNKKFINILVWQCSPGLTNPTKQLKIKR